VGSENFPMKHVSVEASRKKQVIDDLIKQEIKDVEQIAMMKQHN
jgi:hypothetical protein